MMLRILVVVLCVVLSLSEIRSRLPLQPFSDLPLVYVPNLFTTQHHTLNDSIVFYTTNARVAQCNTTVVFIVSTQQLTNDSKIATLEGVFSSDAVGLAGFKLTEASSSSMGSFWDVTLPSISQSLSIEKIQTPVNTGTLYYVSTIRRSFHFISALYLRDSGTLSATKSEIALYTLTINT